MNRILKFRVWDKENKVMVAGVDVFNCQGRLIRKFDKFYFFYGKVDGTDIIVEVELQQFTGLLDKNGKEIYEGDIVYIDGCCKFQVLWDTEHACFDLDQIEFDELYHIDTCQNGWSLQYLSIVGNIFENPELIK